MRERIWRTTRHFMVIGAVLGLSVVGLVPTSAPAAAATAVTGRAGGVGTVRIGTTDPVAAAAEASRHRVVILNADQHHRIREMKAQNPHVVVLAYKDLASTRTDSYSYDRATRRDNVDLPTGVGYGYADKLHPEWFLRDANGARLEWGPWPNHWHMDVGNPTYQQAWLTAVSAELTANGWDGVFMDNANWRRDAYNRPGPAKYPNDDAMAAATRSMLARVGPALRAQGFTTVANIAEARLRPGLWADWLSFLDGAMEEHFTNWSGTIGGPFAADNTDQRWRAQVEQVATAARTGKFVLNRIGGVPGDHEAIRYGVASLLLADDGRSSIAPPSFANPPHYPELDWNLGTPLGAYRSIGENLYRRDFSAGTVIVNAAERRTTTTDLGGRYLDHDGATITTVTLGPTRAAILRGTGATVTAPPSPGG